MPIPEPEPFDSLLSLEGRVAIVTGGTRGTGSAIVLRFVQAGASVVITARGPEDLNSIEAKVAAAGGKSLCLEADVGNVADCERVVTETWNKFGRIDVLVNNADVSPVSLSTETSEKVWEDTININLKGAFFLSKLAAQKMMEGGRGGRIINILSTEMIRPIGVLAAYGGAKAGLMAITQSMAKELGKYGIQVNAAIPGITMTEEKLEAHKAGNRQIDIPSEATKTLEFMKETSESGVLEHIVKNGMPMGRIGYPDDLAKAVLFLASGMASYISGTSLLVDGAQTLA
ncbi:SDR family oxidoreductase [Diplogelasinospora grovesii]|uniref:SDR family oxidoreductase n=1 Tax=Diplogelasinospora grovesii TaxID=303347 RepID=A0AAN6RZX4_9PEZI|nr:SDR family oxidoreductase [Diplogelasinospora grovesii]